MSRETIRMFEDFQKKEKTMSHDRAAAEQANAQRLADDEPQSALRHAQTFREPWGMPQPARPPHRDCIAPPALNSRLKAINDALHKIDAAASRAIPPATFAKDLMGAWIYQGQRQQAPSPDYSSPDVKHVEEGEHDRDLQGKCSALANRNLLLEDRLSFVVRRLDENNALVAEQASELAKSRHAIRRLQEQATDMAARLGQEHSENEQHRATMQAIRDLMQWHSASNPNGEFIKPR